MTARLTLASALLLAATSLLDTASAHAQAPALLPVQGYLTNAENALLPDGSYTIRFRLYDSPDPQVTTALHDEVLEVPVVAGYFTVYLGDTDNGGSALDLSLFRDVPTVYLGIKVGADPEATPRLQLATAAFAAVANYCGDAQTLGGIEPAGFAASGHTHAFSQLSMVPPGFADGVDNDTTYTAGSGLALSGGAFSLSSAGCTAGEVWKYNGSSWSCEPDVDTNTTYTGTTGVAVNGTVISLSTAGCTAGEVWKYNGSTWSCEPDVDTNTTYTGTTGVALNGTVISLSTAGCTAGEVWKYNGTTWSCEPDVDTNTTYTGGDGITVNASNQIAVSYAGNGSATTAARSDHSHTETDPQVGSLTTSQVPRWSGTALTGGSITDTGSVVTLSGSLDVGLRRRSCTPVNAFTMSCSCNSGEVAISGGAWPSNGSGYVRESYPNSTGGWTVGCDSTSGDYEACGNVYVLCARLVRN